VGIANAPPAPLQAIARRPNRLSAIWSVPLLALAIAAWLVWDTISKEGPTIEVSFDSAEGLQTGKSPLKFKDIEFGTVKNLRLFDPRLMWDAADEAEARVGSLLPTDLLGQPRSYPS